MNDSVIIVTTKEDLILQGYISDNINKEIIAAEPTDGLWDDERTDEHQIGASYSELEWAMKQKDLGKNSLDFKGRKKEVFDILSKLNKRNLHKMNPIPIYLIPEELR